MIVRNPQFALFNDPTKQIICVRINRKRHLEAVLTREQIVYAA